MSFEAAVGRIDQILQFQQQIFDPGSATSAASPSGGAALTTAGGSSGSTASTDFATALANAQAASDTAAVTGQDALDSTDDPLTSSGSALASDPSSLAALLQSLQAGAGTGSDTGVGAVSSSGLGSPVAAVGGAGTATSAADPRVQAMISEADSLLGKPYVYGGGHSGWGPQSGYDCSGFVSAVLHAGGYLSSPQDTVTLPSQSGIEAGPGQYVTLYDRSQPGEDGHVIIDICGQFYESGGEAGAWGGGGGVEKIGTPSASYLATFNDVLHPAGL